MDTIGTKYFGLYSEVSFIQGLADNHAPLTIVANYDRMNNNITDKRCIELQLLGKNFVSGLYCICH